MDKFWNIIPCVITTEFVEHSLKRQSKDVVNRKGSPIGNGLFPMELHHCLGKMNQFEINSFTLPQLLNQSFDFKSFWKKSTNAVTKEATEHETPKYRLQV